VTTTLYTHVWTQEKNELINMAKFTDETITTARLISFSDGVFAIAVTLLVFNLKVPEIPHASIHLLLPGLIKAMLPKFITYVITFLLVAVYWTFNHRMLNLVTHVDNTFIWMNIYYLLMISFMPFPSALYGSYPNEIFSFIFYIGSMVTVSSISIAMLWYASHNHRLINKELPTVVVKYLFYRLFFSITIFLLSIPLAFFRLEWARYSLFILFPMNWLMRKNFRKYSGK